MAPLIVSVALALGLSGSGADAQTPPGEAAVLTVTVDAAGDQQQQVAMDIADRYAPQGNFSVEQDVESAASTSGTSSSRDSTMVVFKVEGDVDAVIERLRDESHVVHVARR